jgi:hypothetical protein
METASQDRIGKALASEQQRVSDIRREQLCWGDSTALGQRIATPESRNMPIAPGSPRATLTPWKRVARRPACRHWCGNERHSSNTTMCWATTGNARYVRPVASGIEVLP